MDKCLKLLPNWFSPLISDGLGIIYVSHFLAYRSGTSLAP